MEAFKTSIRAFENDPILQEFQEATIAATSNRRGEPCRHYPACYVQQLLYRLRYEEAQAVAHQQQREHCMACHMQACLVLKQFEYILNVVEYVNENYLRVKEKFLRAIDYVENINVNKASPTDSSPQQRRASGNPFGTAVTFQETEYLIQLLTDLAAWNPASNTTHREKRLIPIFASVGAAIGSIVNADQIKKIKENIAILHDATILQDQQITELARYADLTTAPKSTGSSINCLWLRYKRNDRCQQFPNLY